MRLALISHQDCLLHSNGESHPEQARRVDAIADALLSSGLDLVVRHLEAEKASREQLLLAHTQAHIERILDPRWQRDCGRLDDETFVGPGSAEAALRAAGAGIQGVDLLMEGQVRRVFCNVRPPGHHAGPDWAMGFCLFNNVAIAALHALEAHGLERLAIVDFDVHHGNGTEAILQGERRVHYFSSFQHPFYPFADAGPSVNTVHRLPLPAGTAGAQWRSAVAAEWLPALEELEPELILVSAGFDGHAEDDMADFLLREPDYEWIATQLSALADRCSQGRILSMLEGGYALGALGRSVSAYLKPML